VVDYEVRQLQHRVEALEKARDVKSRRERIATAALIGLGSSNDYSSANDQQTARDCCEIADALIAELDKEKP